MNKIIGFGGDSGSGSSRTPVESPDSLQSKSYAQILDLISEGEIEGLVNDAKSIYLDETPLISSDGTENFKGVSWDFRSGTQDQSYISGFQSAENEIQVGVEIKSSYPVIRSVSTTNISAINIRISIPQLTFQDTSTGDLKGSEVSFIIEVNNNGSGWVQKSNDTIIGKCVSKYIKSYRVDLSPGTNQIRIKKMTNDSTSTNLVNKIYWDSYGEVIDAKLRYPNSAIVAIRFDASQFGSIPSRSYDMRLLRVKVPSNYNSYAREYSGIWDGTFKVDWTDNPAWIFYDLVTNERYGLGTNIDVSNVDKWSLYSISKYCDELVEDGFGGTEPRFTCNVYFQTRVEAYNLIKDLSSVFRSMAYWSSGLLTLSQDSPVDPSHLFSPSNVIGGEFQYQGASKKNRYSVALVSWNDPSDFYRQKIEYVEDQEAIAKYGIIQSEVTAFGCTSRGQAHRLGRWIIYTSQLESETVTFQTGIEAAILRPGQVIKVQDPLRAGKRLSGRVSSATLSSITIDKEIDLKSSSLVISVMLPNGTVEDRTVSHIDGRTVNVSDEFSIPPHRYSVWVITSVEIDAQLFRIVSVSEDSGVYSISALSYNPNKFDFIEKNISLPERKISFLSTNPDSPTGLKITETLYETSGEVRVKATFSWDISKNASTYTTQYRTTNGNIISIGETSTNSIDVLNIEPGDYEFFVSAVSALGKKSSKSSLSYKIIGKAYPPSSVDGFSIIAMADTAYLSWNKTKDLDVSIGGSVRIRYSPKIGAEWKDAVDLALLSGSSTRAQVPLMSGSYLAKFIDSSGNSSTNESVIVTTAPEALKLNVVRTITEDPLFYGGRDKIMYVDSYGGISLSSAFTIDQITETIDQLPSIDYMGGVVSKGHYYFNEVVDLTDVYVSNLRANIEVTSVNVADTIDLRLDTIDRWTDFDGTNIDDVNAEIQVQTTDYDPSNPMAIWSEWKRFFVGQYKSRGFRFRVELTSESKSHSIIIKKLSLTVDMPDRSLNISGISSELSVKEIVFEAPFAETPSIGITATNLQSGDFPEITDKTPSGFKIIFKDGYGNPVIRSFDLIAKGFGRKIDAA